MSWKRSGSPMNLLWEAGGEETGGFSFCRSRTEGMMRSSFLLLRERQTGRKTKSQTLQTLRGQHANIVVIVQAYTPKTPPIDLVKTRKSKPEARQSPQRVRNKNNVMFVGFNRTLNTLSSRFNNQSFLTWRQIHLCKPGLGWCQTVSRFT